MICEKCASEIETVVCKNCGGTVIRLGPYCYACGEEFEEEQEETNDFSDRILCSDGACIGIINEQGVCKVCGKPYTQES